MPRWVVGDLRTGKITADLLPVSGSWEAQLNGPGSVACTVLLDNYVDPATGGKTLDVRGLTTQWRSFLAAIDPDTKRVHGAGPVIGRPYDADARTVNVQATGMSAIWFKRVLAPPLGGKRITDVTTDYPPELGLSKGTIASRLVQQAMQEVGGDLPIDLPPDSPGDTERHYPGLDAALLGDRLKQLTEVQGGPDIMYLPYLADDTHIRWRMVVGTEEDPFVHQSGVQSFDYTAPLTGASGLQVDENAGTLASRAFEMGGGQTDEVLAGQHYDPYLVDHGWPLLETVTNRSSVGTLDVLDDYAEERTLLGRKPLETWTLSFRQNERPFLASYGVGDFARLNTTGDLWVPDGRYFTRIVGIAGDHLDEAVKVTFMEGVTRE